MGLPRRFLNLIMEGLNPGAKMLRCIDLDRHKFFNTRKPAQAATSAAAATASKKIPMIHLPRPSVKFRAGATDCSWAMSCFPLAGRTVLCADQCGRAFLFDLDTRMMGTLPDLHRPKSPSSAFCVFVPGADGGSLYVMEGYPACEPSRGSGQQLSHQFVAFVSGKPTSPPTSFTTSWHRQLLPPPPFVLDPKYRGVPAQPNNISSYALVGSGSGTGSHICVSVDGFGTYSLDTANHVWSQVGDWTLPFQGKVEYVPELKLWFGLSAKDGYLAAADLSTILSTVDSQPQLVGPWKELVEPPRHWRDVQRPQLVHLGCGRFCIARSFHIWMPTEGYSYDPLTGCYFTVLTGADVVPCVRDGNGGSADANCSNGSGSANGGNVQVELEMIRHESRLHMSYGRDGTIMGVF